MYMYMIALNQCITGITRFHWQMPEIELPHRPPESSIDDDDESVDETSNVCKRFVCLATDVNNTSQSYIVACMYNAMLLMSLPRFQFVDSFWAVFLPPLTTTSFVLLLLWFTVSFG